MAGGICVMYFLLRKAMATAPRSERTAENQAAATNLGVSLSTIQLETAATGSEYAEAPARVSCANPYVNCDEVGRNLYEPLRK